MKDMVGTSIFDYNNIVLKNVISFDSIYWSYRSTCCTHHYDTEDGAGNGDGNGKGTSMGLFPMNISFLYRLFPIDDSGYMLIPSEHSMDELHA